MTFTNGRAALEALKTHLQSTLTGDYAGEFETYGGVDVVLQDDEPQESERAGRPYILMSVESDGDSARYPVLNGKCRDAVIRCDAIANDFNGARTGAANPEGSDTKLSRALIESIDDSRAALKALGLCSVVVSALPEVITQNDETPTEHVNPHRITFTYFTP